MKTKTGRERTPARTRLLVITDRVGPDCKSGSDVFCDALIRQLGRDYDVTVIAKTGVESQPDSALCGEFKLVSIPESSTQNAGEIARLVKASVDLSAQELVYNLGGLFFGTDVLRALEPAIEGIPLVNHFQIVLGQFAWQEGYESFRQRTYWECQKAPAKRAAVNIFPSVAEHQTALAGGFELGDSLVSIIPNGVDPEDFKGVRSQSKQSAPAADGPVRIFAAGRFSSYSKGGDLLCRAFADLRKEWPDTTLAIVSDCGGSSRHLREAPWEGCNLRSWMPRREMLETMAAADLVVVPSRYEPFGMIAVEAMSLGLPVVAGFVGGLQEIIVPEVTGRLVEPESGSFGLRETISGLLRDSAWRRRMGRAGKQRALREYTIARVAEMVDRDLRRALLRHRSLSARAAREWRQFEAPAKA